MPPKTARFLQVWSKERPYERRNTQKNVGSSTGGGRLSAPQADVSCLLAGLCGDRLGPGVGLSRLRKISSLAYRRLPQHHPRKPRVPSFSTAWLWPSLDGIFASAIILGGKFYFELPQLTYAGLGLLIAASVWNSWPQRAAKASFCSACVPAEAGFNQGNTHGEPLHEAQNRALVARSASTPSTR